MQAAYSATETQRGSCHVGTQLLVVEKNIGGGTDFHMKRL